MRPATTTRTMRTEPLIMTMLTTTRRTGNGAPKAQARSRTTGPVKAVVAATGPACQHNFFPFRCSRHECMVWTARLGMGDWPAEMHAGAANPSAPIASVVEVSDDDP